MHALRRWVLAPATSSRRRSRALGAALCVVLVVLGHGALWLAVSPSAPAPGGARMAAVQVRQLVVAAPTVQAQRQEAPAVAAPRTARTEAPRSRTPAPRHSESAPPSSAPEAAPVAAGSDFDEPGVLNTSTPPPLPIYPTRIPASTLLTYTLQRGAATGQASLEWRVVGDRYQLQLQATMTQGRPIERHSQGGFDHAGLAPLRLADRQRGRDVRAANFQRERGLITFSGPRWEWPLHGGTQDRLSWLVQLVAIASAAPDALHDGAALSMWVVGTRGAINAWHFEVRGRESAVGDAWWLVREPEHPYDLRVEVWLDPARGYWPVRLRQTQVPGGEPLEWWLREHAQPAAGT